MKKIKATILSFLLSLAISCCFFYVPISGGVSTNTDLQNNSRYIQLTEYVHFYSGSDNYSIKTIKDMSGLNGDNNYYYCKLSPCGYAIFNENNILMEADFEADFGVNIDEYRFRKLYYGGPLIFIVKESEKYINITDQSVIDDISIKDISRSEQKCINVLNKEMRFGLQSNQVIASGGVHKFVEEEYFENLSQFGTNTKGTCTVLAASILFGYYAQFRNSKFVPLGLSEGRGTSDGFHQYLIRYVYQNNEPGGIFIRDALPGLNSYLKAQGISQRMQCSNISTDTNFYKLIENKIDSRNPLIASMSTSYGASYNHTVVIYGLKYAYIKPIDTLTYIVHMGWHGKQYNSYFANHAWFYEVGYMNY